MEPVVAGSKYLIDFQGIAAYAKKRKSRRIAIQLPEGLRMFAAQISERIALDTGADVSVDADPCFGACDIPSHLFSQADLVVQIGHTEMPSLGAIPKMYFANLYLDLDPLPAVGKALPLLRQRVGVVTNAQYLHRVEDIVNYLSSNKKQPVVSMGDNRLFRPAQLLGCDYTAATSIEQAVDSFLYIGDGDFHPIGLSLVTEKKIVVANPADCSVRTLDELRERIIRQRFGAIELASKATSFGIMVSFKIGQRRPGEPERLLEEFRSKGRRASLIHTNVITPDLVEHYAFEAFVCTACPRIAIDDYMKFRKPIVTPLEARIALGILPPQSFTLDQILGTTSHAHSPI